MKTKIRLFTIICTLGLVGVLNANATLSYKNSSLGQTMEEKKVVKSEYLNSEGFIFNEDPYAEVDYQKEAQLLTKWVADKEEAKTIQILMDKKIFELNEETTSLSDESKSENLNTSEFGFNEDANAEIDYQKEASLLTKWVVDKEEAKAIQKLIEEGKLAVN